MQFDCGPAVQPLPPPEELATWSSRRLLDEYAEAWKWGSRCDGMLKQNRIYLEKAIKDREAKDKASKPVSPQIK